MQNNNNQIQEVKQETSLQLTNEMQMVLPFAESYNQIFSGKVDENEAKHLMIVFAQKLGNTFDKSGNAAIQVCTQDSIRQVAYEILNKRLDLSKSQTSLIVYGTKITLQDEYFGKVALCKRELGISIRGTIIHEGDSVEIEIDDKGLKIINHKTKWQNFSNNITGAWAAAYDNEGKLVETDIMTFKEIYTSWMQSKGGVKDTHKKFSNEMARKTVEGRLAKHIYNKSDNSNSGVYDAYDNEDYEDEYEGENTNPYVKNVDNEIVNVDFENSNIENNYFESDKINEQVIQNTDSQNFENQLVGNESSQFNQQFNEDNIEQQMEQSETSGNDFTNYTYEDIEKLNLSIGTIIKVKYGVYKDHKSIANPTQKWVSVPNTYDASSYTTEIKRIK